MLVFENDGRSKRPAVWYNDLYVKHDLRVTGDEAEVGGVSLPQTTGSEYPLIEYNHIWHTRYAVQGSSGGYEIRFNIVDGPAIDHVFDQHRPGGTRMQIHHNTVRVVEDAGGRSDSGRVPAVAIRSVPSESCEIFRNWFFNDKRPRDRPAGWTDESVIQVHVDEWDSVDVHDNHYGESEPEGDYGTRPSTLASESDEVQSERGASDEGDESEEDDESPDELARLQFDFPQGAVYFFRVSGAITDHPRSARTYAVRDGDGEWGVGYAFRGWSPTFIVTGEVEAVFVPDSGSVVFDGEPYDG